MKLGMSRNYRQWGCGHFLWQIRAIRAATVRERPVRQCGNNACRSLTVAALIFRGNRLIGHKKWPHPSVEPRLQRRYRQLVMAHMRCAHPLATGLALPNSCVSSFAATQAAWRFYGNPQVTLRQLVEPLVTLALERSHQVCDGWVPVVLDWSNLHFEKHHRKADRTRLMYTKHQGYKLLTALAISDKNGVPFGRRRRCDDQRLRLARPPHIDEVGSFV